MKLIVNTIEGQYFTSEERQRNATNLLYKAANSYLEFYSNQKLENVNHFGFGIADLNLHNDTGNLITEIIIKQKKGELPVLKTKEQHSNSRNVYEDFITKQNGAKADTLFDIIKQYSEYHFKQFNVKNLNVDTAISYHLENNYPGKINNISLDGKNGALNKALKNNFNFTLNQDELKDVHKHIKYFVKNNNKQSI